jgi:chemotaxis-related protein WspB
MLALQRPARRWLSTRIVLVDVLPVGSGSNGVLGLIAEKATGTMRAEPEEFSQSGLSDSATPYLGPVLFDGGGLVQRVDPNVLLPPVVRDLLFPQAIGTR